MDLLPQVLIPLLIIGGFVYLFIRRNRERAGNASLRGEIEARVCFETPLDRASILGTGGFGGTRGVWIRLRGPKRLIVGTDAFMVSAPQALREFVFNGPESSIAFGQAVNPDDCIMITGQASGRQVQLAITGANLPDIWQALAGTGARLVLRAAVVARTRRVMACRQVWLARLVLAERHAMHRTAGRRRPRTRSGRAADRVPAAGRRVSQGDRSMVGRIRNRSSRRPTRSRQPCRGAVPRCGPRR